MGAHGFLDLLNLAGGLLLPTDTSSFLLSPLAGERDLCFMYVLAAYGEVGQMSFLLGAFEEEEE